MISRTARDTGRYCKSARKVSRAFWRQNETSSEPWAALGGLCWLARGEFTVVGEG
jgi:hypothetical protein